MTDQELKYGSVPLAHTFAGKVDTQLRKIREVLVEKNAGYGNSVFEPVRIFSTADPIEQIRVRIDDKLSRITRGNGGQGLNNEDSVFDLIGYLVLYRIAIEDYAQDMVYDPSLGKYVSTRTDTTYATPTRKAH